MQETWVQSLGQEDHLEKRMASHSVFLPGKSYGQRSLGGGGYSPWGHKVLDMTEQLTLSLFTFPGDTVDKNPPASEGDMGLIPGPGRMSLSPYTTTT